jgi:ABC-type uncharacterized transport system auxiliary subunit
MTVGRALVVIAAIVGFGGCLFRTAEPPRFYRPASTTLAAADDDDAPAAATGVPVRVQSVRSAPFLRERMVWRASGVEYGLYEQRRWFELPTRYVRRALGTALDDTPGVRLGDATAPARLDVEILAFDEVLAAHHAHVVLAVKLRNGAETRLDRTFAAEAPIAGDDGSAVAEAMGRALDEVVREVATAAARTLAAPAGARRKK